MRSRTSIALWNLTFHYASIIITVVNSILIVPFYLKYIDSSLFGMWLATGNILVWLTIIEPGIGDILQQKVASSFFAKEYDKMGMYMWSGIVISSLLAILVLIVSLTIKHFLPSILNLTSDYNSHLLASAFQITAIGTSFIVLSYAFTGSNQGLQSSLGIGLISFFFSVCAIVLNFVLLFNGFSILSIAYGNLLRGFGICLGNMLYFLIKVKKLNVRLKTNRIFLINFSRLFTYNFLGKLSTTIVNNFDLILVARFVNPHMVTVLELSRRPIRVFQSFSDRLSISFMSSIAGLKGEENYERIKNVFLKFFLIYSWLIFMVTFGFISLNKHLLLLWIGKDVFIGDIPNIIVCITLLMGSYAYNISNFTFSLGDIKQNSAISIKKGLLYIVLVFTLGYFLGIYGIIIASFLSVLLTEVLYYPKRIMALLRFSLSEINLLKKEIIKILIICASLSALFLVYFKNISSIYMLAIIASLFVFLFMGSLFLSSSQFRENINLAFNFIKLKLSKKRS